ncbi:phospholipid scramblase 3-like isoform X3 [Ornithodoros turicata]|uniref:phospholipid scramblase 3-like isoform X3 n=1 Tax=Ornithodoros turicata TaxID=34597 RepID=UPI003138701E
MAVQGPPMLMQLQRPGLVAQRVGLESLAQVNQATVVLVDVTPRKKFFVQGSSSNFLFYLQEDGLEVMVFRRLLRLQSGLRGCFCGCLGQEMDIEDPSCRRIATVAEDFTFWGTSFTIGDARGRETLKVVGPPLLPYCRNKTRAVFQVKTMGGTSVGGIWIEGQISISFPSNLDIHLKGCLIGCAILIWYMFDPEGCILYCANTVPNILGKCSYLNRIAP